MANFKGGNRMSSERVQKKELVQYVLSTAGLDIPFIIQESFLGYKSQ